jgi:division protein CdvB (Snf7/Vps24/ESCRT-III family)
MKIFNRSPPFTDSALRVKRELRTHSEKLKKIHFKLRKRDSSLFEKCTRAIELEKNGRAKIYANELAKVRTTLDAVAQSELAIEVVVIRLENLIELNTLVTELKPTIRVIQSLTSQVAKALPEITDLMEGLNSIVTTALLETNLDFSQLSLTPNAKSIEREEILKEVSLHLEQKLERALPEPPSFAVICKEAIESKEREAVPIAIG